MNDEAKENKFSDEMAALIRNVELELLDIAKEFNIPGIQLIRDAGCILIEDAGRFRDRWEEEHEKEGSDNGKL